MKLANRQAAYLSSLPLFALRAQRESCSARLAAVAAEDEKREMTPREEDSEASKVEPTKRRQHLRVPVFADEKAQIESAAQQAGISVARYLREVGMGYPVRSLVDTGSIRELVRVNADLARFGNLLKLWLDNDPSVSRFGRSDIERLLKRFESTHSELRRQILSLAGGKATS